MLAHRPRVFGGDVADVGHLRQDGELACSGGAWVAGGVVERRGLGEARHHRSLGKVQLGSRQVEIDARRLANPKVLPHFLAWPHPLPRANLRRSRATAAEGDPEAAAKTARAISPGVARVAEVAATASGWRLIEDDADPAVLVGPDGIEVSDAGELLAAC